MLGGEQEYGLRAGTSNVAGIVGLGKAVEIATRDIVTNNKKIRQLRDYFIAQINKNIDMCYLNGHPIQRLSNNVNISFGMVDGESLMMMLDLNGIMVSTGSACDSKQTQISHVLKAIDLPMNYAKGTIRVSFGKYNTVEEAEIIAKLIISIIKN